MYPSGDVFCELRETGPKQLTTNVPRIVNTAFQQHVQDSICYPDPRQKIEVVLGMILLSAQMTTDALPIDRPENRFGLHRHPLACLMDGHASDSASKIIVVLFSTCRVVLI